MKTTTTLRETLKAEIEHLDQVEPAVKIWVDDSSYFWMTEDGLYIWLQDHQGLVGYVDESHPIEELDTYPEGILPTGTVWLNTDFESPFHISDFLTVIEAIAI